jgi:hypothetical protein
LALQTLLLGLWLTTQGNILSVGNTSLKHYILDPNWYLKLGSLGIYLNHTPCPVGFFDQVDPCIRIDDANSFVS